MRDDLSKRVEEVFREFREVRDELWRWEFWSDGYFVRSVGDGVTADVIRRYIEHHEHKQLVFDF